MGIGCGCHEECRALLLVVVLLLLVFNVLDALVQVFPEFGFFLLSLFEMFHCISRRDDKNRVRIDSQSSDVDDTSQQFLQHGVFSKKFSCPLPDSEPRDPLIRSATQGDGELSVIRKNHIIIQLYRKLSIIVQCSKTHFNTLKHLHCSIHS